MIKNLKNWLRSRLRRWLLPEEDSAPRELSALEKKREEVELLKVEAEIAELRYGAQENVRRKERELREAERECSIVNLKAQIQALQPERDGVGEVPGIGVSESSPV